MLLVSDNFGEWLKRERTARGMSQAELGEVSSLHRSVINKLESGTKPQPETLQYLAKGLRLPVETLYIAAGILKPASEKTQQEAELIYLFNLLPDQEKKSLIRFIQATLDDRERLSYWGLNQILFRRAKQAGIPKPGLHDFRRAFAINFLRNSPKEIYSLQHLMGHADLQILRRYLKQTDEDIAAAHRRASPVDNWRL